MEGQAQLENISDTAFWVAQYRADETKRPDALFRDPLAAKLIGEKGQQLREYVDPKNETSWPIVIRTYGLDNVVREYVAGGCDMVICLAAGLDTRPYRLDLPADLKWVEVDLPEMIRYKSEVLKDDVPKCKLERIPADLSSQETRKAVFSRLAAEAKNALVITEGLLIYLDQDTVASLAGDLSAYPQFSHWVFDLASPGLVRMLMKRRGDKMERANAPFKFGPKEGPAFFVPYGWVKEKVYSALKTAAKLKRVGFIMRLFARLPEPEVPGNRIWSGICVMKNQKS